MKDVGCMEKIKDLNTVINAVSRATKTPSPANDRAEKKAIKQFLTRHIKPKVSESDMSLVCSEVWTGAVCNDDCCV